MQTIECCVGCTCIFMPLTVMQAYHLYRMVYAYRQRRSRPLCIYVCIHRRVHAGTYGQPVAAQFLRNFPPRLPKLTLTVNHSLRKVYASPKSIPDLWRKNHARARARRPRTVIFIFMTLLKHSRALTIIFNRQTTCPLDKDDA